jgi:hypothetical protein
MVPAQKLLKKAQINNIKVMLNLFQYLTCRLAALHVG